MKQLLMAIVCLCCMQATVFGQNEKVAALVAKGVELHDKGDYEGAVKQYKAALQLDDQSTLANFELANTYFALKQYQETIVYANKVIDLNKDNLDGAFIMKGSAEDLLGKPDEAIATYQAGIRRFPGTHLLHYNLALTAFNQKEYSTAKDALEHSVKLKPTHPTSHLLLGYIMYMKEDRIRTLLAFYNFLLLEPNSSRSLGVVKMIDQLLVKGITSEKGKNEITINAKSLDSTDEFSVAELTLSLLGVSGSLEVNKDKTKEALFVETTETLFKIIAETDENKQASTSFWATHYIRFYKSLLKEKKLETLCYYIRQSTDSKAVKSWLKDHPTEVKALLEWNDEVERG